MSYTWQCPFTLWLVYWCHATAAAAVVVLAAAAVHTHTLPCSCYYPPPPPAAVYTHLLPAAAAVLRLSHPLDGGAAGRGVSRGSVCERSRAWLVLGWPCSRRYRLTRCTMTPTILTDTGKRPTRPTCSLYDFRFTLCVSSRPSSTTPR